MSQCAVWPIRLGCVLKRNEADCDGSGHMGDPSQWGLSPALDLN